MGFRDKMPHPGSALLACLVLAGCGGGAATQTCQMVHVTDLKLERHGRAFFTTIQINGHDSTVELDTGSDDNLITEEAAHRLGMPVNVSGWDYVEGVGGQQMSGVARSRDVRLGDAHGERLEFTTVPDRKNLFSGDGLLGMPFLHDFDMDLDFWGGRVGLYKAISGCDAPRAVLSQPLYAVDLINDPSAVSPEVFVSINGVRLRARIDTGAERTAIFRLGARRAGLLAAEVLRSSEASGLGPRSVKTDLRISAPVVIGDLTVNNMPVDVIDQRSLGSADERQSGDTDMLLGYDFVTRVHLWISRSSGTLIMQYPPQASPPTEDKS
jgi:predicted aspartyl protease